MKIENASKLKMLQNLFQSMFILTGFQPFGSFSYNPAEILAEATSQKLKELGIKCSSKSISVTPKAADQFYDNLIVIDQTNLPFIVHIGLNASESEMTLETQAQNCLCFSSNEGDKTIDDTLSIESILVNPIDVKGLQKELYSQFSLSNDAGTYLCNYIYYRGLQNIGKKIKGCIFVHIPLFEVMPQATQMENLCNLVQKIQQLLLKN